MFPAIEELNRLKAVERAAHARLDRLNRTCPATDEVIKWRKSIGRKRQKAFATFKKNESLLEPNRPLKRRRLQTIAGELASLGHVS